ncbi:MAG: hypothetical protein GY950_05810, partial [bacterium]|nr:hypothetical protein [bacterium]
MTKKISLILILVLFLFQAVMTADAEQPDKKALKKIEKLLKKGTEKVKEQEFEKAFEYYNKALEISKEYA